MKKIIITSFILISTLFVSAQVKKDYYIQSIPEYDSLGNMVIYKQTYDHKPTKEDTIEFYKNLDWRLEIQTGINNSIRELKKQGCIPNKNKKKPTKKLNN